MFTISGTYFPSPAGGGKTVVDGFVVSKRSSSEKRGVIFPTDPILQKRQSFVVPSWFQKLTRRYQSRQETLFRQRRKKRKVSTQENRRKQTLILTEANLQQQGLVASHPFSKKPYIYANYLHKNQVSLQF